MNELRGYWRPGCSSCVKVKEFLTKLGVHSKTDAVVAAIRFGKATPPGLAVTGRDTLEAARPGGLERVV